MNDAISILSCRRIWEEVGWACMFEFEDILARLTGGRVLAPVCKRPLPRGLRGIRRRLFGSYTLEGTEAVDLGGTLVVVALTPTDLEAVTAIGQWRSRFKTVVGYVVDSFASRLYPAVTAKFDHLFVPIPES